MRWWRQLLAAGVEQGVVCVLGGGGAGSWECVG